MSARGRFAAKEDEVNNLINSMNEINEIELKANLPDAGIVDLGDDDSDQVVRTKAVKEFEKKVQKESENVEQNDVDALLAATMDEIKIDKKAAAVKGDDLEARLATLQGVSVGELRAKLNPKIPDDDDEDDEDELVAKILAQAEEEARIDAQLEAKK